MHRSPAGFRYDGSTHTSGGSVLPPAHVHLRDPAIQMEHGTLPHVRMKAADTSRSRHGDVTKPRPEAFRDEGRSLSDRIVDIVQKRVAVLRDMASCTSMPSRSGVGGDRGGAACAPRLRPLGYAAGPSAPEGLRRWFSCIAPRSYRS